jgi:hypothetical protein
MSPRGGDSIFAERKGGVAGVGAWLVSDAVPVRWSSLPGTPSLAHSCMRAEHAFRRRSMLALMMSLTLGGGGSSPIYGRGYCGAAAPQKSGYGYRRPADYNNTGTQGGSYGLEFDDRTMCGRRSHTVLWKLIQLPRTKPALNRPGFKGVKWPGPLSWPNEARGGVAGGGHGFVGVRPIFGQPWPPDPLWIDGLVGFRQIFGQPWPPDPSGSTVWSVFGRVSANRGPRFTVR